MDVGHADRFEQCGVGGVEHVEDLTVADPADGRVSELQHGLGVTRNVPAVGCGEELVVRIADVVGRGQNTRGGQVKVLGKHLLHVVDALLDILLHEGSIVLEGPVRLLPDVVDRRSKHDLEHAEIVVDSY